jgi:hypothetical protein
VGEIKLFRSTKAEQDSICCTLFYAPTCLTFRFFLLLQALGSKSGKEATSKAVDEEDYRRLLEYLMSVPR